MGAFVEFQDVTKIYHSGDVEVKALSNVSFEIEQGEFCVIVGESGAGKTTLLNILGGMDTLTSGTVNMDGVEISAFNRTQLENYRRFDIGFVFQFLQPDPQPDGTGKTWRLPPSSAPTTSRPSRCWRRWAWATEWTTSPPSSPAASSSGCPSPALWPSIPSCCCVTSPPAPWTTRRAKSILKLLQDTCRKDGMTVVIITHNSALAAMARPDHSGQKRHHPLRAYERPRHSRGTDRMVNGNLSEVVSAL